MVVDTAGAAFFACSVSIDHFCKQVKN